MTGTRCLHGVDNRFCAICNRRSAVGIPRPSIASATLSEIVEFLNDEQIRATYRAVGDALGVVPRSLVDGLSPRSVEGSWIVSTGTGLPTDYAPHEMHSALLDKSEIIGSGIELVMRLTAWKARREGSG